MISLFLACQGFFLQIIIVFKFILYPSYFLDFFLQKIKLILYFTELLVEILLQQLRIFFPHHIAVIFFLDTRQIYQHLFFTFFLFYKSLVGDEMGKIFLFTPHLMKFLDVLRSYFCEPVLFQILTLCKKSVNFLQLIFFIHLVMSEVVCQSELFLLPSLLVKCGPCVYAV